MKYLEYKQIQSSKKIKYRRQDPLFDYGVPTFYVNRFIYIRGKTLRDKLFFKLLYLMKGKRYPPMDMFYLIFAEYYINIKTVHIRIAGRPYHIPVPISTNEGHSMLVRFLAKGSKLQIGLTYEQRLLQELEATAYYLGRSYTRRSIKKMFEQAKEGRIFAHFRWR